jgi:ribosomal protein S18
MKEKPKEIIKYKVLINKHQEYSTWLLQQVQSDPNFKNFKQISHIKSSVNDKLNYIIDYLQTQNSSRYLTEEMKIYIRKIV